METSKKLAISKIIAAIKIRNINKKIKAIQSIKAVRT